MFPPRAAPPGNLNLQLGLVNTVVLLRDQRDEIAKSLILEGSGTLTLHKLEGSVGNGQKPQPRWRVSEKTPGALDEVTVKGSRPAGHTSAPLQHPVKV